MAIYLGKAVHSVCRWCLSLSVCVFGCFTFGFGGRMWDLIVSVPDHCLSFYFVGLQSLMLYTKFEDHRPADFGDF